MASQRRRIKKEKKIMAAARRGKKKKTLPSRRFRQSYTRKFIFLAVCKGLRIIPPPPPSNSEVISLLQCTRVKHETTQHCVQVTVTRSEPTPNWEVCFWLLESGKLCSAGRRGAEKEEKRPTGTASLFRFALMQSYFVPVH